jgi:hypothetical protein
VLDAATGDNAPDSAADAVLEGGVPPADMVPPNTSAASYAAVAGRGPDIPPPPPPQQPPTTAGPQARQPRAGARHKHQRSPPPSGLPSPNKAPRKKAAPRQRSLSPPHDDRRSCQHPQGHPLQQPDGQFAAAEPATTEWHTVASKWGKKGRRGTGNSNSGCSGSGASSGSTTEGEEDVSSGGHPRSGAHLRPSSA